MVSQSIRVNFIPSGVQDRLHASQYDTGERVFSFLCFYGSSLYEIPSGAVVTLNGQKPGGYTFVIPCTYDGSTVTCDCTASMTDVDGLVTCELEVVTNGEVVQSGNFYLVVEKAAIDSGAVPTSDFEAVSQMVADAAESAQAAEEAAASIDPSTFVQKSEITRSTTQTTTGEKVVDAVELNPDVNGTLAKKISDAVKKADLSSSGTVTTPKQVAVDAWQLNPDNTGSYAAGVNSQIASLTNSVLGTTTDLNALLRNSNNEHTTHKYAAGATGNPNSSWGGFVETISNNNTYASQFAYNPFGEKWTRRKKQDGTFTDWESFPYMFADKNGDPVTLPNNTTRNAATIQLPTAGLYLIICTGVFSTNANGSRQLFLANSETGGNMDRHVACRVQAANGSTTAVQIVTVISATAARTIYLNAIQNSGAELSISYGVRMIKLK